MSVTSVPLESIADIQSGAGFPTKYQGNHSGEIPFAKVGDISKSKQAGENRISTANNYVSREVARNLRAKIFAPDTIVFAKIGEAIRGNRRVITDAPMAFDNNVMGLSPDKSKVDPSYLYHFLETVDFYLLANSTTVPSIRKTDMSSLQVPLPTLDEQKRIATTLDQADTLRRLRQRVLDKLNTLGKSIFYEMFGDPATNPMGWQDDRTLGEVADIASGITKGRKFNGQVTREVAYLAVINVQDHALRLDPLKTIEATEKEINRYRLRRNDLLLTEGGDPDKLGRGTLWREELAECIHQNHVFRVRLNCDQISPVFLNWLVGSERGKRYFLRSAKQTTGIASINMTQLRGFPILVPPLQLQREFERQLTDVDLARVQFGEALKTSASLFASLQQRAFQGEL